MLGDSLQHECYTYNKRIGVVRSLSNGSSAFIATLHTVVYVFSIRHEVCSCACAIADSSKSISCFCRRPLVPVTRERTLSVVSEEAKKETDDSQT